MSSAEFWDYQERRRKIRTTSWSVAVLAKAGWKYDRPREIGNGILDDDVFLAWRGFEHCVGVGGEARDDGDQVQGERSQKQRERLIIAGTSSLGCGCDSWKVVR